MTNHENEIIGVLQLINAMEKDSDKVHSIFPPGSTISGITRITGRSDDNQ